MKSLTLTYAGGDHEEFTVEDAVAQAALTALTQQEPAFAVILSETAIVHVNMRQVASLAIGASENEEPEPEPEDTRTVAELKAALDEAKVEYPSEARKAELLELAKANNV